MKSVAITDHGVMYGAVEFYKEGLKQEIKPIIGMEGYMTNINMRERPEKGSGVKNFHLLLLAKDFEGKNVKIGKCNVDENGELAAKYNVMSIPSFMVFKNGAVADQVVGGVSKEKLQAMIEKHL